MGLGGGEEVRPYYLHNFYTHFLLQPALRHKGNTVIRIIKRAGSSPLFPRLQTNTPENGGRGDQDPSPAEACVPAGNVSAQTDRCPGPTASSGCVPPTSWPRASPGSGNADLEIKLPFRLLLQGLGPS